ncbi:MAG: hypothetical protein AB7R40_25470 [Nitrospiraceae bacterium]
MPAQRTKNAKSKPVPKRSAGPASTRTTSPRGEHFHDEQLVDEDTAAVMTDMSVSYLQRDRQRKKPIFPFKKIGRSVKYQVGEIRQRLQELTRGA